MIRAAVPAKMTKRLKRLKRLLARGWPWLAVVYVQRLL